MTEYNKVHIHNHETTQQLYHNLAIHKTFSDGLIYLILMKNVHSLVRERKVSNSDNRQNVIMALQVVHIGIL